MPVAPPVQGTSCIKLGPSAMSLYLESSLRTYLADVHPSGTRARRVPLSRLMAVACLIPRWVSVESVSPLSQEQC